MASVRPTARHFSLSLYTTGLLQAATLVLELSGSKSKYMSPVGFPQEELLRAPAASSTNPILLVFAARICGDCNPGLRGLAWVWDSLLLIYPSQIFIHVGTRPAYSASAPVLPSGRMLFQFCSCQTSIQLDF